MHRTYYVFLFCNGCFQIAKEKDKEPYLEIRMLGMFTEIGKKYTERTEVQKYRTCQLIPEKVFINRAKYKQMWQKEFEEKLSTHSRNLCPSCNRLKKEAD